MSVPQSLELEEVQALAAHVPSLTGKQLAVTPLDGGLTNRNYRLDVDGQLYVVRIAGAGTELLGIDRDRELACCQAAAAAGIGPAVVAYLPGQRTLVTRFVNGSPITEADARRPEVLSRLAQTLRRCHDYPAPADLGRFSPFETIRNYHVLATERDVPFPAELSRALGLLDIMQEDLRTAEPPCLCHNDLLPANFIDEGVAIRLIDWEYGGLGDRFFDLGNFAVNHQLDDGQERLLLEAYFSEVRPDHLRRLRLMRLVSDLREAMWGFLQAGVSKLHTPDYYLDYGRRHLGRFLEGCHVG